MNEEIEQFIQSLNEGYKKEGDSILPVLLEEFEKTAVFATSMGAEDQVLTDILVKSGHPFRIITLDTGRLFYETYDLMEKTERRYSIRIEVYFPDAEKTEDMVREKGINLFYASVENRKLCCAVRKLEPLERALNGARLWITGLRREQSVTRTEMQFAEWDEKYQTVKINPLIDWTWERTLTYIKEHKVPYNPLHDQNFPSIGCAPCTRAILEGEDIRAGRWWWENPETKECGLHISDGQIIRNKK